METTAVKDLNQSMEKDDDSVKIIGDQEHLPAEFPNHNANLININSHHSNSTREPSPKLNQNNMNLPDLADFAQSLDEGRQN